MTDSNPPSDQPVYEEPAPQKRSPMALIIGFLVAVLLIVAIVAIVNNDGDGDSSDTSLPGADAPAATDAPAADPPATDGG